MERFLLRSTRGLVEMSEQSWPHHPLFIHEFVRQYLLAGGLASLIVVDQSILEASTHAQLAQWCLSYVQMDSSTYLQYLELNLREPITVKFPLLTYAWENVFHHMELAHLGGITQITCLEIFPLKLLILLSKLVWVRASRGRH